jgi:tetratricopeptide (TPR) repeat protein
MKRTRNILSGRLLAAVLAVMLLCMPAFAWGDSWGKSSAFEVQTTNGGLDSLSAEEWFNEGNALYDLGKHDEAIKAYDRSISINPQYAEAWNNKGNALYGLGKYDEAIKAYDQAISINPQYANAWNNKGVALQALGRTSEADAAFAKAEELENAA